MQTKEITINGKTYPVAFCLKTMVGFENIAGHSFFGEDFSMFGSRIALVVAAVFAADEDADIKSDDLLRLDSWKAVKEVIDAFRTVLDMSKEFFSIPEVEPSEPGPDKEEEGVKN